MEKVKFYSNFKRENKWLGIIDYKSLSILLGYIALIFFLLSNINIKLEYLIYIFIFFTIPVFTVFFINIGNESIYDVIIIIFKFYKNKKIYIKKDYIYNINGEKYIKKKNNFR